MSLLLGNDTKPDKRLEDILSHPGGGSGGIDILLIASRRGFSQRCELPAVLTLNELIDHDRRVQEAMQQLLNLGVELL